MATLGVSRAQVYNLRTQWLSCGKTSDFLGVSGGDHAAAWPVAAIEHLKILIQASREDGPNYELYSDELSRKFGFVRDRSNVRKYCEKNLMPLLRDVFPIERKPSDGGFRRWECPNYGELWQHDSTPCHIWGPNGTRQNIIISLDDATRTVAAHRICERENLFEHFAMLEEAFMRYGIPETLYTDGFSMFGKEGYDLCSQFGRMCRALGINHMIAPTPQAKGKIERSMRTFQHRLAIILKAGGADNAERANVLAREHIEHWNKTHTNDETGEIPARRAQRLITEGKNHMRKVPDENVLRLFLSKHEPHRVELGRSVEFLGKKWNIAKTEKKTVWLAIRPGNVGFYVLEECPDPTHPVIPRILAKYKF